MIGGESPLPDTLIFVLKKSKGVKDAVTLIPFLMPLLSVLPLCKELTHFQLLLLNQLK